MELHLVALLRAAWIAATLPILIASIPSSRLHSFHGIVLGFARRGKIMPSSSYKFTVPQRFFCHFYVVAVAWTTLLLLATWLYACRTAPLASEPLLYSTIASHLTGGSHIFSLHKHRSTPLEHRYLVWQSVFLLLLMEVQVMRRLYETMFLFGYSRSARMHVFGYLAGLLRKTAFLFQLYLTHLLMSFAILDLFEVISQSMAYHQFEVEIEQFFFFFAKFDFFFWIVAAAPLSLCCECASEVFKFSANQLKEFIIKGKNQMPVIEFDSRGHVYTLVRLGWPCWLGAAIFIWGWIHQHRCHAILGLLREQEQEGEYGIPHGDWFDLVSSPHYLAEIVIYSGLLVASGGSDLTIWLLFGFVASNLVFAAAETHRWYLRKFDNYPANRFAVIPSVY